MRYYECHVTMEGNPEIIRPNVEQLKWKFSRIDEDIILGPGVKCYATRHFNEKLGTEQVLHELLETAKKLSDIGINVIRRKVELVIFDDRSTKTQCRGSCIECHLVDYLEVKNYNG